MIIVQTTDFTGFWSIATNNKTEANLQQVIDLYERSYLNKLLGVALADLFVANLTSGVPTNPIYLAIYNAFTDECGNYSKGVKDMLKGFLYYDYVTNNQAFNSQSGVGINEVDTTAVQSFQNASRSGEIRWNDALESFDIIQQYIVDNLTAYPTFKGTELKVKFSQLL